MKCFIIVGWDQDLVPHGIYVGSSGEEADEAHLEVVKNPERGGPGVKSWTKLARLNNPAGWSPLPIVDIPTVSSGEPLNLRIKREAAQAEARGKSFKGPEILSPPDHIAEAEEALRKKRYEMGQPPAPPAPKAPPAPPKGSEGPGEPDKAPEAPAPMAAGEPEQPEGPETAPEPPEPPTAKPRRVRG